MLVTPQGTWQYEYDAFGNRSAMVVDGDRTEFVFDPSGSNSVTATYDGGGGLLASYALGIGLEGAFNSGDWSFYDFDALGSTAGLSGDGGAYTDSYVYDPFGGLLHQTGTSGNPFQFVGALGVTADGNGLDFMGARQYDVSMGRFTTMDPLRLGGMDQNLYRYAGNQPTLIVDPSGLRWCWYGPFGESPFVSGGPPDFVGLSVGAYEGTSVGISGGLFTGESAGASVGLGGTAGVGPTVIIGPSVEAGANAGLASVGGAGAGVGAYATAGVGVSSGLGLGIGQATGGGAGIGLGYSHGNTYGFILGWGPCPEPPELPDPPDPPDDDDSGDDGDSDTVQSQDPNDLLGPAGYGPQHYVKPGTVFPYRIDFENASTASAPAQRVTITNQLSDSLDWSSLEFVDVGFGDTNLLIPSGSQHYETTSVMTFNNQTFDVIIQADLDPTTGLVTVSFQSIDPNTQLPPDVLTGFLPPENGTGRGQGHISYLIKAKTGLPTDTEIRNVALIKFDANTVIATNQVDEHDPSQGTDPNKEALVTIDADAPTSAVLALPTTADTLSFPVSWSGNDLGSGIRRFTIFVSDNAGPFLPWLTDTTLTTATYTGQNDHTYRFFSVATDNVGNVQPTPTAAQAVITLHVSSIPPQSTAVTHTTVTVAANPSVYGQSQSFVATVLADGGATATGSVQFYIDGTLFGTPVPLNQGTAHSSAISTLAAGVHTVTAAYAGIPDMFEASTGTLAGGPLVVTPAPLLITVNRAYSRTGALLPEFSASYSGFVNGEGPSDLTRTPVFSTSANFLSFPGTYSIHAGAAESSNYAIRYVDGTLVVDQPILRPVELAREAFVATVYQDVLARSPDSAGLASWTNAIASGISPRRVVHRLWTSPERSRLNGTGAAPQTTERAVYRHAILVYRSMYREAHVLRHAARLQTTPPAGPRRLLLGATRSMSAASTVPHNIMKPSAFRSW
jgi:RHS repeat-associated protein